MAPRFVSQAAAAVLRTPTARCRNLAIVTPRRFYREGNTPQATSNVSGNPQSGSPEEQATKTAAGRRQSLNQDSASVAKPVSNPEAAPAGIQEEPQPSQEHVKRDPKEPDAKKRAEVLKEGNKPLDPADK